MITSEDAPAQPDEAQAQRLASLAERRSTLRIEPCRPPDRGRGTDLDARLERLAHRTGPNAGAHPARTAGGRRRHPARKSRMAALVLSLVTTGGLTATFSALDGPADSLAMAPTGLLSTPADSASATAGPASSTSLGSAGATAVVTGDVYSNRWGPVQVQAQFGADGTLVAVNALQVPYADGKSVAINARAVPTLNGEALTSQSAVVDTVSGATYTSVDYRRSLQSAIDEARAAGLTELT